MSGCPPDRPRKSKTVRPYSMLYPLISKYHGLLCEELIKPYDFVGIVILAYVSLKKPRCYFDNMIQPPIIDASEADALDSISVVDVPELMELLNIDYLLKKFKVSVVTNGDKLSALHHLKISSIFNQMKLAGIKQNTDNYINHSIVQWANNRRPFVLMFSIPSPMTVLRMQAVGTRVLTVFVKEDELDKKHVARLNYMEGNTSHEKDSFEFLIHDLKHMEHFVDEDKYFEQVGFFHSMLAINRGNLKKYFTNMLYPNDMKLWYALEYVISDMNCYLPHLFKYLLAKLIGATKTTSNSAIAVDSTVTCDADNSDGSRSGCEAQAKPSQFSLSSESIQLLRKKWILLVNEMNPEMKISSPEVYSIACRLCDSILHLNGTGWSNNGDSGAGSGMSESVGSAYTDQSASMTVAEAELLRDYYKAVGKNALQSYARQFPL